MRILLLAILLGSLLACTRQAPKKEGDEITVVGQRMPSFDILLNDTVTKLNTTNIPEGQPVVLFFFGPDCPYCQNFTRNLTEHIDELKDIRFYMVSVASPHDIQHYDTLFSLNKYKNIVLGRDVKGYFISNYKAPGYPYMAVYDKHKKFKQIIIGGVSIDSLKTVINSKS